MTNPHKPYFPMFVDLTEKRIVVVGAGTIAKRRIRSLLEFTNNLTVIAPEVNRELLTLQEKGLLSITKKKYDHTDIQKADIVIAATNDAQLNSDIYRVCKAEGIMVNVCSDKSKCDFYFPGIARKDNVVVGVTASGSDHKKARSVIERIRQLLEC
ncbi:MAG: bifunctional precorrin-2 dehydrogenase/sirohydrochlorin ferrochelatase [Lachnospiraceae bacterium]|nr:bifunctional precorrin-2 dehydrogenase/sirohydrochlorin ferrochelatase [Lachnospiraceae bacterium]